MKKTYLVILLIGIFLIHSIESVFAAGVVGVDTGIENDITYQEVVFLSGKPILLTGTVKVTEKEKNGQRSEKYTYKLENKTEKAKLNRSASFLTTLQLEYNQSTGITEMDSFKESVEINGVKYETDDKKSKITKSEITHQKPAVDYFAGDYKMIKTYDIDKGKGEITVDMSSTTVGYEQYWGATETRVINGFLSTQSKSNDFTNALKVNGSYDVKISYNRTRDIEYIKNQPTQISFRGGYLVNSKEESIMEYSYDINKKNSKGSYILRNNPKYERLIIPDLKDISGHWAENDIRMLASLKAFEPNKSFFGPNLPIKRSEFAKAISVICDIVEEEEVKTRRSKKGMEESSLYSDLSKEDKTYNYVKSATNKGLMFGVGDEQFNPDESIDKAQAVAIIIRALGFENLAPNQNYSIGFRDDGDIPYWARDSVYVATQLGIVSGTENGYFQPEKKITKAEAANMLSIFVNYLRKELKEDYRERIINY